MKRVLVIGAGRSASVLIDKLYHLSRENKFIATVADITTSHLSMYTNNGFHTIDINIEDHANTSSLISNHDIVVSLLPPQYHTEVAKICLNYDKHFITASYLNPEIKNWHHLIEKKGLYFVNEMGLDPGIDHLLAMEMIDNIKMKGGVINGFESYCGGLVSPESDNNPFHYKVTWNPSNLITAGKQGAHFLENGKEIYLGHLEVFEKYKQVEIKNTGVFDMYANRDSMSYIKLYGLENLKTFIRGTLRIPNFCDVWAEVIRLGLTNEKMDIDNDILKKIIFSDISDELKWLLNGFELDHTVKASDFLLDIFVKKMKFEDTDKDRVVLYHKVHYTKDDQNYTEDFVLDRIGQNKQFTAMSETVSLPILSCIELIIENGFGKKGIVLPFENQHYIPILRKLRSYGLIQKP